MPNPVNSPDAVGAIQWIDRVHPVQPYLIVSARYSPNRQAPYQKSPMVKEMPPTMAGGNRHSGMGMSLFALNFLVYEP